jgi:hypothetical protein
LAPNIVLRNISDEAVGWGIIGRIHGNPFSVKNGSVGFVLSRGPIPADGKPGEDVDLLRHYSHLSS